MEKLSKRISEYIVNGTELDYEVIKYGIDAILSTGLCFSIALLVCTLLDNLYFGIIFICFLTPIKMQFTSYHCKTMTQCIITYTSCVGTLLLIYNRLLKNEIVINLFFFVITIFVIVYFVQVQHEINNKTTLYLCLYLIMGAILYFNDYKIYLILLLSLIFELILILLKRIESH